ncbi:hypothetical protein [Marinicrinis lubricantis]|uniref:DJ-1/PfpI domain-containing protein n=1 Tax=Marinicrinis lubricantis TaxID=2086470 RepID=A0ABW1INC8_9BACL
MKKMKRKVCLLMNLGGFETRTNELLAKAYDLGETVYSLTGEGVVPISGKSTPVPVNVMSLTTGELHVWSSPRSIRKTSIRHCMATLRAFRRFG